MYPWSLFQAHWRMSTGTTLKRRVRAYHLFSVERFMVSILHWCARDIKQDVLHKKIWKYFNRRQMHFYRFQFLSVGKNLDVPSRSVFYCCDILKGKYMVSVTHDRTVHWFIRCQFHVESISVAGKRPPRWWSKMGHTDEMPDGLLMIAEITQKGKQVPGRETYTARCSARASFCFTQWATEYSCQENLFCSKLSVRHPGHIFCGTTASFYLGISKLSEKCTVAYLSSPETEMRPSKPLVQQHNVRSYKEALLSGYKSGLPGIQNDFVLSYLHVKFPLSWTRAIGWGINKNRGEGYAKG